MYHNCKKSNEIQIDDLSGCTCSILKNILRYSNYYTEENNQKFCNILISLIMVNSDFKSHLAEKSIQMYPLLFIERDQKLEDGRTEKVVTPIPILKLAIGCIN